MVLWSKAIPWATRLMVTGWPFTVDGGMVVAVGGVVVVSGGLDTVVAVDDEQAERARRAVNAAITRKYLRPPENILLIIFSPFH
jgi:hypothetical protein